MIVAPDGVIFPLVVALLVDGVNVIALNVSPLANVATVTWLVPVAILPPYVIDWSFAVIVIAFGLITIFIVASFVLLLILSVTVTTTLYVPAGVVFVNDIFLSLLNVAPFGAPLFIAYVYEPVPLDAPVKALLVYAVPYVPVFNVWLLNVKSLAVQFAVNVTVLTVLSAKLLNHVPFTLVLAFDHVVVTVLELFPYLALAVSSPLLAVHPSKVYPVHVGFATLYAVP